MSDLLGISTTFDVHSATMKNALFVAILITLFGSSVTAQIDTSAKKIPVNDSIVPQEVKWNTDYDFDEIYDHWVSKNKNQMIRGFRIQLYNGNRKEAESYKIRFLKSGISQPSFVVFETPEFKAQVGNFRNQLEAEKVLQEVRKHIPGAFVVKTKIYLPELAKETTPE